MRSAYRVLAYIVAVEVVIQAAAISYALAGLGKWVSDGGTLDKAAMESEDTTFTGVVGFIVPRDQRPDADPSPRSDTSDHLVLREDPRWR